MIEFGKTNCLKVVKTDKFNIILDGEELGEILIPRKDVSTRCRINDDVNVFIYKDSKGKIIATARKPLVEAGQFAFLKVVTSNSYGAFLDWGLEHDLRVPVKEQQKQMRQGQSYVVYVYNEKNNRITASSRLNKFLGSIPVKFKEGQMVDIVIGDFTAMGYRAIINGTHLGALYRNEVFQILKKGQALKGFIKKIRDDGKIDLSLQKRSNREAADELSGKILGALKEHDGILNISDKTSPERIYSLFGVSKKRYKNAIGTLYKKRLIVVEDHAIRLAPKKENRASGTSAGKKRRINQRVKTRRTKGS